MNHPKSEFVARAAKDEGCCPFCGSDAIDIDVWGWETETGVASCDLTCGNCGEMWRAEYKMVGISWWDSDKHARIYSDEQEQTEINHTLD